MATRRAVTPQARVTGATKLFFISKYPDLRQALLNRGWKQVTDPSTARFDIKWIPKSGVIKHDVLRPHQIVNHFVGSRAVCCKV